MQSLHAAITRLLRPVVRLLMARGVTFPVFSDWAKGAYLAEAEAGFDTAGKRIVDSRVSVMTGLQRKDIKQLRTLRETPPPAAGPIPRILARWQRDHRGDALDRAAFDALVAQISRDIHPRTMWDEVLRLGLAEPDGDRLKLLSEAYVPTGDEMALLGYLGGNAGDHLSASVANLTTTPAPFFERAVHYNQLGPEALEELDRMARDLQSEALSRLGARALELQTRDAGRADATGRFRCGAYIYRTEDGT